MRTSTARQTTKLGMAAVAALLVGATGCGGTDSSSDRSDTPTVRTGSSIIADWPDACHVHDVDAIKEFMGIREFGSEPGEGEPGGGFSRNVQDCDVTAFDMSIWERPYANGNTETDDSLSGRMYLRVNYYASQDRIFEIHDNARAQWAEGSGPTAGRHIVDERTLQGDWDEARIFLGSDKPDAHRGDRIVIADVFDGGWSIRTEILYDADPVAWWPEQQEQLYPFTDAEIMDWVADTYLPQVYAAIQSEVAAAK